MTCQVYTCTVAYTGQVTFYKVPEKHGHVYLVRLYLQEKHGGVRDGEGLGERVEGGAPVDLNRPHYLLIIFLPVLSCITTIFNRVDPY